MVTQSLDAADTELWRHIVVSKDLQFDILIPIRGPGSSQDSITQSLLDGTYPQLDRPFVDLIRAVVPPGDTVLDLGAHVGVISLAVAAAGYRVIAVDGSPLNVSVLRASASRNGFDHLRVIHAAVSDSAGMVDFLPNGPFGHIVGPDAERESDTRTVRVQAVAVDDLLVQLGCECVGFVKMDIEGGELAAIRGMRGLLASADAPPVLYESNGYCLETHNSTTEDLKAAFEKLGYRNYRVKSGSLVLTEARDFQPDNVTDYLATRKVPHLEGWSVSDSEAREEIAGEFLRNCSMAKTTLGYREHIVTQLDRAPIWLLVPGGTLGRLSENCASIQAIG